MIDLPMPSDLAKPASTGVGAKGAAGAEDVSEPPSVKLLVRLFIIPFLIVAAAVGIMYLISLLAGGTPSVEEAITLLKQSGGGRTDELLVGPGSKQRYMAAKALTDQMKAGMNEGRRIELSARLIDIIENHTNADEGEIRHFLLLALGRVWQQDPSGPSMNSAEARSARENVARLLIRYADDKQIATRKAAVLAMVYLAGTDVSAEVMPKLVSKLNDSGEDLDVRLAAATALGPLASGDDKTVIAALEAARRDDDPRDAELVWRAALSLAELNQADVAPTIMKLLSRDELAGMRYYDREADPKNPVFRPLNEQEQQRILINTMIGARHLQVPEVQEQLAKLAKSDPSARVRAEGKELEQK